MGCGWGDGGAECQGGGAWWCASCLVCCMFVPCSNLGFCCAGQECAHTDCCTHAACTCCCKAACRMDAGGAFGSPAAHCCSLLLLPSMLLVLLLLSPSMLLLLLLLSVCLTDVDGGLPADDLWGEGVEFLNHQRAEVLCGQSGRSKHACVVLYVPPYVLLQQHMVRLAAHACCRRYQGCCYDSSGRGWGHRERCRPAPAHPPAPSALCLWTWLPMLLLQSPAKGSSQTAI